MASVTAPTPPIPAPHTTSAIVRIEPPRGWLDLRLGEVWAYRELLYFFVWRDVKVRYKQTAIGVAWVVIQPLLTMGVFTLFFGRLAKLPSDGLPYPVFYFCSLVPWTYFATALQNCTSVVVQNQHRPAATASAEMHLDSSDGDRAVVPGHAASSGTCLNRRILTSSLACPMRRGRCKRWQEKLQS